MKSAGLYLALFFSSCLALTPATASAQRMDELPQGATTTEPTLQLEEVLITIYERHPTAYAALLKRRSAEAKALSERGAFDLDLGAGVEAHPLGGSKKAYSVLDFTVTQPTTFWGLFLFAGWHSTMGNVPIYKDQWSHKVGKDFTGYKGDPDAPTFGRAHAGVAIPLLRDGAIDKRRAEIQRADAYIDETDAELEAKLLELEFKASEAYWDWIAAGMALRVRIELLETAVTRQSQVEEKVRAGADAPIYATENRQYILKREKAVVEAEQKLAESAIKLSQYWRPGDAAEPAIPTEELLLPTWPPIPYYPSAEEIERIAEGAVIDRPEVNAFRAQIERAEVLERYYSNQLLPRLDFSAALAQPLESKGKMDVRVTLDVSTPLQRRTARGARQSAAADVERLRTEQRVFADQAFAEVQAALVALQATREAVALARSALALARELEEAELIKFRAGASTLLIVNLREQAAAEAAMDVVEAEKKHWMAYVRYRLMLGQSLLEDTEEPLD